jgi:hypothetical protein
MRVLFLFPLVAAGACSTTSSTSAARALPLDFDAAPPVAVAAAPLPRPQTPGEAGLLIAEAVELLQRHDGRAALPRFEALLRCDFLTERGRANLYWLAAEAARGVDDDKRRDALAGYLVAASVVPSDPELRDKVGRARAMLLADKVQSDGLGESPERAIVVDNAGEADSLVAQLGCGARGMSPYVERHGLVTAGASDDDGPAPRRLLCTENGDELVLWFRIDP